METTPSSTTRKADKNTDAVTAELRRGFEWTTTHTTLVLSVIAIFIIGGGGYVAYSSMAKSKEAELQAKYYAIESVVNKKRADFDEAKNPTPPQPGEPTPTAKAKPTGDMAKDYGDVTDSLLKFAQDNPKSAAGAMAALNLASLQAEYNQPEAAITTLKTIQPSQNMLGALVRMELATQIANAGNCPEADAIWAELIKQPSANFLKAEAKLKMGLCAETQGDTARAQAMFKEVETEFKDTAAGRSAAQYQRLLSGKTEAPKSN